MLRELENIFIIAQRMFTFNSNNGHKTYCFPFHRGLKYVTETMARMQEKKLP